MARYMIKYDEYAHPPILTIYAHNHPHKRQHREVLQKVREQLLEAAKRSISNQVDLPIDHPLDLNVVFVDPLSPDLDHLIEALFMAMDAKSLKGPSLLKDDRHIQKVTMSKYYPNEKTRRDGTR